MQAKEPQHGRPRGAAGLLRSRAGLIAADWKQSCPDARDVNHAAVLAVLVKAVGRCGGTSRAAHRHEGAEEIFAANTELLSAVPPDAVSCLRDVIRRQVLLALPAAQALTALHCTSAVLDQLLRTVTQLASAKLERLAYIDELTGLPNRRTANDAIHAAVAQAVRYRHDVVAVVIDVDHLKEVNDEYGHDVGDHTLRRLADAFRSGLRDGDLAFRTGGDEFLVLLPETQPSDVASVMARVRAAGAPPFSYGAASAPDEADTVDALLRTADQRLLAWRRQDRAAPAPAAPRRHHRTIAPIVVAAVVALIVALLSRTELLTVAEAGRIAGLVALLAGGVALLTADASRERRGQVAGAVLAPMAIYGVTSVFLQTVVPPPEPRSDRAELSRSTDSMTATSSGHSAVAEVPQAVRRRAVTPTAPAQDTATTSTSMLSLAPVWLATSTATTEPLIAKPTSTTQSTTTTSSTSPTTSTPTTTTPTTTTTTTPTTTPTTSTSVAPSAAGDEDHDDDSKGGRPEARDDHVRSGRPTLDVHVLRNDRAGKGDGGALDPNSVVIVTHPEFGEVEVRPGGIVRYRGGHKERPNRFRYRVCTEAGRCAEAWGIVERRPR